MATTLRACVWPRVNSAEPCVRGVTPTSIVMSRISSSAAPVGALLVDRDALTDDRLLERLEGDLGGGAALAGGLLLLFGGTLAGGRAVLLDARPPRPPWSRPGARACPPPGWRRRAPRRARRGSGRAGPRRRRSPRRTFFSLPASAASSRCSSHSFLIAAWAMSSASRISASGISLAPASTIRIASSVPATTRSRSERLPSSSPSPSAEQVLLAGVDDEVAVDLADPHRADGRRQRDVGDHQRPPRRRSWRGCRRGGRGRSRAGSPPAGCRSASPWGTAGGSGGRSCAPSASPSRRDAPRA